MSYVKQTQHVHSLAADRQQRRYQLGPRSNGNVRAAQPKAVVEHADKRVEATYTADMLKTTPKRAGTAVEAEPFGILKRSLSKLRLKDTTSPNKQRTALPKRLPLQPASKIPQATAPPSSTRVINTRPEQSSFVLHGINPPSSKEIYSKVTDENKISHRPHAKDLQVPSATLPAPASPTNKAEVRKKAMQLGIFKISDADLKERYRFLNEIGTGEWGSVWAVEALRPLDHLPTSAYRSLQVVKLTGVGTYTVDNTANFRPLAVKLCKRETKHSAAARTSRLWNEFKVLRTLMDQLPRAEQVNANSPNCRVRNDRTGWHPNIVNFYEFLLTPGLAMLVMPKCDEAMKVCLGETMCRNYFQQLLSAVHWLHQHGVCHNDIKVDNLCVTYDTSGLGRDMVTLLDFGFANRYDPVDSNAFMSRDNWGTPEYLSPERCRSTLHDERKADIWALGITFFEMLTGRTPFEHHDEKFDTKEKFEVYYARAERGSWFGEWDFSGEMEDLIRKMLRHDPEERIDAAGALLHPQFDPKNHNDCDSFDELLQLSTEDENLHRAAEPRTLDQDISNFHEDLDDSDAMIEELVGQTDRLEIEPPSLLASPGVSRATVAARTSLMPGSPSLSQVGMDSRLTDLMCVSPPWRGARPPRQGTPIPSAQRDRILNQSLIEKMDQEDDSDASVSDHSPVRITRASRASISKPALLAPKPSPFRLRLGQPQVQTKHMASTPLSAPAVIPPGAPAQCPTSLPPLEQPHSKPPVAARQEAKGNVVASLAKKFDASNFLSRPPPHVATALGAPTGGLGLTFRGQPAPLVKPNGHRRSKSYTLATTQQPGAVRKPVRRSTGSLAPASVPPPPQLEEEMPPCARRLFAPTEVPHRPMHSILAGSPASDEKDALPSPPTAPDEVVVKKLKRMASLAGMLTKMIDETKTSLLLTPSFRTPNKRTGTASTEAAVDISPGLLSTPKTTRGEGAEEGDASLVSAAFSLDLSGSASCKNIATASSAQVEGMYSSFLLSQNVCKSGEGFMSPTTQPPPSSVASSARGGDKRRTLAALFAPLRDEPRSPVSPLKQMNQRSIGKGGKLARLFRKQA